MNILTLKPKFWLLDTKFRSFYPIFDIFKTLKSKFWLKKPNFVPEQPKFVKIRQVLTFKNPKFWQISNIKPNFDVKKPNLIL